MLVNPQLVDQGIQDTNIGTWKEIQEALREYSEAELATIDEFLQEQDDEESDDEVNIFMTTILHDEDIEEDEVTYGTTTIIAPSTQDSKDKEALNDIETDLDFFWADNDIHLSSKEASKPRPNAKRISKLKEKLKLKSKRKFLLATSSPSTPTNSDDDTFQQILEDLSTMTLDNHKNTGNDHKINNINVYLHWNNQLKANNLNVELV